MYRALSTEAEVKLAPSPVYKDCVSGDWVCTSCKFNQSGLKKTYFVLFLMKKSEFCEIFSRNM